MRNVLRMHITMVIKFSLRFKIKFSGPEYEGPYIISTVNVNGTVRVQKRKYYNVVNIRNIKPYKE